MTLNYLSFYILSIAVIFSGCKKAIDINPDTGTSQKAVDDFTGSMVPGIFYNFKF
jgi:hypothetical protein